jgi:hypothetical protein
VTKTNGAASDQSKLSREAPGTHLTCAYISQDVVVRKESAAVYFEIEHGIYLEGLRKITERFRQDDRCPGQNMNPEPQKYET